jgi:hypothetical protein
MPTAPTASSTAVFVRCLNQVPVDVLSEERVDVIVTCFGVGTAEVETFPVADAGHQLDTEQMSEREDGLRLSLSVSMKNIGLDVAFVLE